MVRDCWRLLRPLIRGQRGRLFGLALVSTFVGFFEAGVLVLVVRAALSIADKSADQRTAIPIVGGSLTPGDLLGIAGGLAVLSLIGHFFAARLSARLAAHVLQEGRSLAITAFSSASWSRQSAEREGALQETMSTLVTKTTQIASNYTTAATALINLLTFLIIAAVVDPLAMLAIVFFGAVLAASLRPFGRITQRNAKRFVQGNATFSEEVSRTASLAMEYRLFGVEDQVRDHLEQLNAETGRLHFRTRAVSLFESTLYRDVSAMLLVGAVAGIYAVGGDALTGVGTVVVLIVRGLSYGQLLQGQLQLINEDGANVQLFMSRVDDLRAHHDAFGDRRLDDIETIEFDHATYEYVAGVPALTDFTLRIERGEVIGVVGPSGGGKSTLVQLLLRLRAPQQGAVRINGIDLAEFDPHQWATIATLVPQEPRLMEGSVADNIAFLRSGIARSEIELAADAAHVGEDIRRLSSGFDTELGARGSGLSGGQKQRVAIARALVGHPKLLVLDEPTSALDGRSEQLLKDTIASLKGSVTMVIVAHRLTTLSVCDRLLVLEGGRLTSIGTPGELRLQSDFFQAVSSLNDEGSVPVVAVEPSA